MPNPNGVSLDVRNFPSSGDGWADTTASNGQTYSYKYTGGDASTNNGKVTCRVNSGRAAINVGLIAADQYHIDKITFEHDDPNDPQLSTQGSATRTRVINDKNTVVITANYKVTVIDTGNSNVTVPCDPQIINTHTAS